MATPDPPPEPTNYRVLLSDPEGFDAIELQRVLQDCSLRVLRIEEVSERSIPRLYYTPQCKGEFFERS